MPELRLLPTLSVLLALATFYYWHSTTARLDEAPPSPAVSLGPPVQAVDETPVLPLPEAAEAVGPAAVEDRPETDAIAEPAIATAQLSGWVRSRDGDGLGGVRIEMRSLGLDGEEIETHRSASDAQGAFGFDNLVAGRSYRLEIQPGTEYAGFNLDSITADANASFQEIILDTMRLVDVDGMIVDTNLAPIPDFTFRLRSLVVDFPERVITSDSSGYFRLEGFPEGELRIATSNRDYYRIKGLELKADEYHNLTLVVDRGIYHLSGWVTDEFGTPLEEARVTIKSAFAKDEYHSFSYRSTLTDGNGAFEFPELGGNRYTLGVYVNGFESHIQNLEFLTFSDTLEIRLTRQPAQIE